jgi:hypothetical protein
MVALLAGYYYRLLLLRCWIDRSIDRSFHLVFVRSCGKRMTDGGQTVFGAKIKKANPPRRQGKKCCHKKRRADHEKDKGRGAASTERPLFADSGPQQSG